jgi:cytoplasmic iron level regulating protein YaaA (DUF328/UPF0246 family)
VLLDAINGELAGMPRPVAVNLASEEYFKAAVGSKIQGHVIQPVFEDWKNPAATRSSAFYRQARARPDDALRGGQPADEPEGLKGFDYRRLRFRAGGFGRCGRWVFRRRQD